MGFLEKFLALCKSSLDELLLGTDAQAETYTACFRLLYGAVNLKLDIESEALLKHPNPLVKKLWKKSTGKIECQPNMSRNLKSDDFWVQTSTEVFMLDIQESEADDLEKDWGMMVLTPNNIATKARRMLQDAPVFAGQHDRHFTWSQFFNQKHCFHSAVLADNYIEPDLNKLKSNLFPLIKTICSGPPRKRMLHITIITTSDGIELLHKNLLNLLEQNNLSCKLRIVKTQTLRTHDRHLITNQRWIFSGFGFTLLKWDNTQRCNKVHQSTTILCMPFVSNTYIAYPGEDETTEPSPTHFTAVQGILGRLERIDADTPNKIGAQIWAIGERSMFGLTKTANN
jgi:hypothetical protein